MNFNSELFVNEKALSGMKDVAIEFAHACVMECSRRYEFDGEEAVKLLGLRNPTVKTKITKENRVLDKPKFKFPYSGGRNEEVCQGLILNGGLFTQCEMSKKTQLYCGKCSKQAEKNSHGAPNYGTIMDRNSVGIMEYIDPTGKGPVPYLKFINKKKWNLSEVQDEAKKYSIIINDIHFVEEISTKKRGRKPRVRAQVAYDTDDESSQDMFDTIIEPQTNEMVDENPPTSSSNDDDEDEDDISAQVSKLAVEPVSAIVVEEVAPPQAPAPVLQVIETPMPVEPPVQEIMVANVLEEEIEEKVETPKEVRKKSENKSDKSEKLKQKEIEKQRKRDEKNAAAAAKEMEKKKKEEEAKAKKALEKSNSKISKSNVSKSSSNSTEKTPSNTKADMFCKKGKEPCIAVAPQATSPTPAPKKAAGPSVSVKPFTHDGVKYYKSTNNILYDKDANPQGKWDETTKTVTPISVEDQEAEEEEDDDEDDNSEEEEEEYEEEEELGSARYTSAKSELLDEIEYYECLGSD